MTSECYVGGAEMQLTHTTTPVTSKGPGLNPNANVFHAKSPTTPPSEGGSASEWTPPDVDSMNNILPSRTSGELTLLNGESNKTPPSGIPTMFPPTPESPLSTGVSEYTNMNGVLDPLSIHPTASDPSQSQDDITPLDGTVPDDQLRALIKTQLEYYFSRENLASDSYLVSQMDADQYVSITTIASFNQVKRLTNNIELVIEILRESGNVQVDERGEKVRPLNKRCIVILREIPNATPVEEVENLFRGANCPQFVSCEFAHNDNWYVTFESEEEAQKAYRFLREEVGTFQGKPIMARIKAKPLLRSSFVPKNGFKQSYDTLYNQQKYATYAAVPNLSYLTSQPLTNGYPFFPPTISATVATPTTVAASPLAQPWPVSSTLSYFDPGTAFAANGYTPSPMMKLPVTNRQQGFNSMRHRNQKPHRSSMGNSREPNSSVTSDRVDRCPAHDHAERPNGPVRDHPRERQDRERSMYHDRHLGGQGRSYKNDGGNVASYHNHNHHHHHPVGNGFRGEGRYQHHTEREYSRENGISGNSRHSSSSDNSKEQLTMSHPARRGGSFRGRRRPRGTDDTGANRSSSSSQSAKDKPPCDPPNFDLADTSFPPLPGSHNNASSNEVFESKLSDIVKGTAKLSFRDGNKSGSNSSSPPPGYVVSSSSQTPSTTPTPTPSVSTSTSSKEASKPVTTASQVVTAIKTSTVSARSVDSSRPTTSKPSVQAVRTTAASVVKAAPPVSRKTTSAVADSTVECKIKSSSTAPCASLPPTPPQSPQKLTKETPAAVSKVLSSSNSDQNTSSSKQLPATSIATTAASDNPKPSQTDSDDSQDKGPKKLSYAEMAQRGKIQTKSAEKSKDDGESSGHTSDGSSTDTKEAPGAASVNAAGLANGNVRSGASRDDGRDQRPQGPRRFNGPRRANSDRPSFNRASDRDKKFNRESDRSRAK